MMKKEKVSYLRDFDRDTPKLLEYLFNGGTNRNVIKGLCLEGLKTIDERYDCADFRCGIFVRVLLGYREVIGSEIELLILKSLCNFPFFETSGNSMCTWTENHQLVFMGNAYLLGKGYPDLIMFNNMSGKELSLKAQERLVKWSENVFKYGFSEFGSCNYYPESLAAIGNLIEFSKDEEIVKRFKIVLDLLLYDVFACTLKDYSYNKATARAYLDNKLNYYNYMAPHIRSLLGEKIKVNHEREACFFLMVEHGCYYLPQVFKEIFACENREIKESNGSEEEVDDVLYLLGNGAISNDYAVQKNIRYFCEKGMMDNKMLSSLKRFKWLIIDWLWLFSLLKKVFKVRSDDMAIGKANIYSYVGQNYVISSLQKYHLGRGSFQQVTHMVNIDGLACFSFSSDNIVNADCRQDKDNLFVIYKNIKKTFLYFPYESFDENELDLKEGYLFGKYHDINIMIKSNQNLKNGKCRNNDLEKMPDIEEINCFENNFRGNHYYIFKVNKGLDFAQFKQICRNEAFSCKNEQLRYGDYEFEYGKKFCLKEEEITNQYHRYESFVQGGYYDYGEAPLIFKCGQASLKIAFKTLQREEKI